MGTGSKDKDKCKINKASGKQRHRASSRVSEPKPKFSEEDNLVSRRIWYCVSLPSYVSVLTELLLIC
jgi:hypothetical protein